MEWPPRSGKWLEFPEVDDVRFLPTAEAIRKVNPAQAQFIAELQALMNT